MDKKIAIINQLDDFTLQKSNHTLDLVANNKKNVTFQPINNNQISTTNATSVVLLHDYTLWRYRALETVKELHTKGINVSIVPTEFFNNKETINEFNALGPYINKIIVHADYIFKILKKNLNKENQNKVKLLPLLPSFPMAENTRNIKTNTRLILTIGILNDLVDYSYVIKSVKKLQRKNFDFKHILALKPNPNMDQIHAEKLLNDIIQIIKDTNSEPFTKIFYKDLSESSYQFYLNSADVVITPPNYTQSLYERNLIDCLYTGQICITNTNFFSLDMSKKGGFLLYKNSEPESLYEALLIVLNNEPFARMLREEIHQIYKPLNKDKIQNQFISCVS